MRYLMAALLLWTVAAQADDDQIDELFLKNQDGGELVITVKDCHNAEWAKLGYENYAYATEGNGTKHEGCWVRPPLVDAPKNAFGIVNTIWEGNYRVEYPDKLFYPRIVVTPKNGI